MFQRPAHFKAGVEELSNSVNIFDGTVRHLQTIFMLKILRETSVSIAA
jgi:hypothetical protein